MIWKLVSHSDETAVDNGKVTFLHQHFSQSNLLCYHHMPLATEVWVCLRLKASGRTPRSNNFECLIRDLLYTDDADSEESLQQWITSLPLVMLSDWGLTWERQNGGSPLHLVYPTKCQQYLEKYQAGGCWKYYIKRQYHGGWDFFMHSSVAFGKLEGRISIKTNVSVYITYVLTSLQN